MPPNSPMRSRHVPRSAVEVGVDPGGERLEPRGRDHGPRGLGARRDRATAGAPAARPATPGPGPHVGEVLGGGASPAGHHLAEQRPAAGDVLVVERDDVVVREAPHLLAPGQGDLAGRELHLGPVGVLDQLVDRRRGSGRRRWCPSCVPTPKASIGAPPASSAAMRCSSRSPEARIATSGRPASSSTARTRDRQVGQVARVEAHPGDGDALVRQLVRHLGGAAGALHGVVGVDEQHHGGRGTSGRRPGRRPARRRGT